MNQRAHTPAAGTRPSDLHDPALATTGSDPMDLAAALEHLRTVMGRRVSDVPTVVGGDESYEIDGVLVSKREILVWANYGIPPRSFSTRR